MKRIRFGALFIVCFINLAYAVEALAETSGEKFSMENIEQSTIADIKRFRKAAEQGNIDAQFTRRFASKMRQGLRIELK